MDTSRRQTDRTGPEGVQLRESSLYCVLKIGCIGHSFDGELGPNLHCRDAV